MRFLTTLLALSTAVQGLTLGGKSFNVKPYKRADKPLQDIVTWDEHSLFVRGQRLLFYSGEFHPFRLPVPGLWLDVFQKIKALGYNGVSAYFDWALLEGQPGNFTAEGIFALEPFFEAASTAGIYILARPGPYINAEVSGGGFPGWLQRLPALLRTREEAYLNATQDYVNGIGAIMKAAQITEGGPIILMQPENEYSVNGNGYEPFPDAVYWQDVEDQFRDTGIIVPFIENDASPQGYFAPGPPQRYNATVDIYGYDGYPLGFDCANPYTWPDNSLPTYYGADHINQSISTPNSIVEFQGGSFDPWGGPGFAKCTELLGPEFERVFYKNNFGFGVTIFNIYMTYGGTNWGNLGQPGGYTSYDYGAVIAEDRTITRQKYSEAKLLANFLQASPAYLTAEYQNNTFANGSYTGNQAIAVTGLFGDETKFYVVRHAAYNSLATTDYRITFPTKSQGNITVPQLGNSQLSLHGRDSKIYVTDYDVGGVSVLYSTAEIFTWKKYGDKRVLVVYTGPGETNEIAVKSCGNAKTVEGNGVQVAEKNGDTILQFSTSSQRRVVELDNGLSIYILDRQSAYNYWVVSLPEDSVTGNFTNQDYFPTAPIIKAGNLLRTVNVSGNCLHLTGDVNVTTPLEVISGAPQPLEQLTWNGKDLSFKQARSGVVSSKVTYNAPNITLPNLRTIGWKTLNTLPEIQANYSDALWPDANHTYTHNLVQNLTTPTSLFASDYGFNTGYLLFRGHFTGTGNESTLYLSTQGGNAYGHSIWLNDEFVGSYYGNPALESYNTTYNLPSVKTGSKNILTILIDNNGLDENYDVGDNTMQDPRGILDYNLAGHSKSDVTWKLTGNLHGEDYEDRSRGPLNAGGLYAERQGYYLPGAPTDGWTDSPAGPMDGIDHAGVAFYATTFDLNLPQGYDIPLSVSFTNSSTNTTATTPSYRVQIYINGYQFGKYVYNIGPQDDFPVPEGIWNFQGSNYMAVTLWSLEKTGAKVSGLALKADHPVQSGYGKVVAAPQDRWVKREGAY